MTLKMADKNSMGNHFENQEKTDDIFDEDIDDDYIVSKEWEKIQSGLLEGGYREGLTLGKESKLQNGFNEGFSDGAQTLYKLAKHRGEISARLSCQYQNKQGISSEDENELQKQLNHITQLEKDLINASKSQNINEMKMLKSQQIF
ncbi:protein YAE1 homolog [Mytilus californianus]|uniref:protein YAE1 homolog n=1 Tax=Mytilus californianus TaxID=6549 RepID=UPI0022471C87|nr:protein YAE1 homolog [Mytilus californianus]